MRILRGHSGTEVNISPTPDGRGFVSASWDGLRLWDFESGRELFALRIPADDSLPWDDAGLAVGVASDGLCALSGAFDGSFETMELPNRPSDHCGSAQSPVQAVAFCGSRHQAISGQLDGQLILWDLATRAELRSIFAHRNFISGLARRSLGAGRPLMYAPIGRFVFSFEVVSYSDSRVASSRA
jgi:WD40 repeat protein